MRIGICSTAANNLSTYGEQFARLKELGFDALDHGLLDINEPYYKDVTEMEKHCREVREAAEKNDLFIFQVHGPWPTDDTTEESRAIGWDCMHRAVYGCYLLGSKYLVIHPQMPFGWNEEPDSDYAENMTLALIRDLLPDCEKYGIVLCLENMPFRNQRISSMKNIVAVVEKIDSEFVGICFDTGHCNFLYDDIAENIRLATPYLKVLHVHDNDTNADSHWVPFEGNIDWSDFVTMLAESGYNGVLSLETDGVSYSEMSLEEVEAYQKHNAEAAKKLSEMVENAKKQMHIDT